MDHEAPQKLPVAFLGPPSSYTHQATVSLFDRQIHELEPQLSIKDVFIAVQSSAASFGVVPFENSSNGSVSYTVDCLIDRDDQFSNIVVCGEVYMDVQHCLIGYPANPIAPRQKDTLSPGSSSGVATPTLKMPDPHKPRSHPLVDLGHIADIYSHPQAFGQCRDFISAYMRAAEQHEVSSTSKAAEMVTEQGSRTSSAISSRFAAGLHGLTLLAEGIQDIEDNTTRFLILRRRDGREFYFKQPSSLSLPKWKALVAFSIDHETRGALAKALTVYKEHQLNLTCIDSRPSRIRPWHYIFMVEFECEGEEDIITRQMDSAFHDLGHVTEGYKCLGYWEKKPA